MAGSDAQAKSGLLPHPATSTQPGAFDRPDDNNQGNKQEDLSARNDQGSSRADLSTSGVLLSETTSTSINNTPAASDEDLCELARFKKALRDLINDSPSQSSNEESIQNKHGRSFWSTVEDTSCDGLLAKYVSLWSILERPDAQQYSAQAYIGLKLLEKRSLDAANKVFKEIEFQTSTPAALSYVMGGVGRFLAVFLLASSILAFLTVFLLINARAILSETDYDRAVGAMEKLDPQLSNVVIACVAGMFGSVVSLLLRIGEFESTKGRSQMFLRLTGSTLPVIGGMFGACIAALLCSKIINIPVSLNVWTFVVIGFLSGFSERFSRGFLQLAEKRLGVGEQPATNISTEKTVLAARVDQAGAPKRI